MTNQRNTVPSTTHQQVWPEVIEDLRRGIRVTPDDVLDRMEEIDPTCRPVRNTALNWVTHPDSYVNRKFTNGVILGYDRNTGAYYIVNDLAVPAPSDAPNVDLAKKHLHRAGKIMGLDSGDAEAFVDLVLEEHFDA